MTDLIIGWQWAKATLFEQRGFSPLIRRISTLVD